MYIALGQINAYPERLRFDVVSLKDQYLDHCSSFFMLMIIFSYVSYNHLLTMYADDTLLIDQGTTLESSINACQRSLDEVTWWCNLNLLSILVKQKR